MEGATGWAIGSDAGVEDHSLEIASLHDKLEHSILPLFCGNPSRFAAVMRLAIALTPAGDTLDSAERWADQQELEDIVKNWLRSTIRQIEQERSKRESTPACPSRPVDAQKLEVAEDVLAIRGHKEYGARAHAGPKPKENPDP
ncbi:MAG: hypothetical protein AUH86_20750 [Acidobacteria bacterium 13_1_40CM_4_58_4]|nr:MAG: hypothetical protein AUH86_20750 [Acidobacteria bacterium 13_1_40CM_4_58_4]